MKSTLLPEKPILVYPSLASTIGLDECVFLSALNDLIAGVTASNNNGFDWYNLPLETLAQAMPFWDNRDLQRVSVSLREKGVLIIASGAFAQETHFKFAFNERAHRNNPTTTNASNNINSANDNTASTQSNHNNAQPHMAQNPPADPHPQQNTAPNNYTSNNAPAPAYNSNTANSGNGNWANIKNSAAAQNHQVSRPYEQAQPQQNGSQNGIHNYASQTHSFTRGEQQTGFLGKNHISASWKPDRATLDQLAQHAINEQFSMSQVPEFITYWRERGEANHSWGSKFMQHTLRQWRTFEAEQNKKENDAPIDPQWKPSLDAMEVLVKHAGINREFIEDSIPEFILYWQERGERLKTWNTKFIQHIRVQWKKYNSALEHSTDPKAISIDWQPSEDVFDVLRLANIDIVFAQEQIPEFVLYWRDTNQLHSSWNTRYLQRVKRLWAQRHALAASAQGQPTANRPTRDISLEEQLTDRSWAD